MWAIWDWYSNQRIIVEMILKRTISKFFSNIFNNYSLNKVFLFHISRISYWRLIHYYRVGKEPPPEPASPIVMSTFDGVGMEQRPSRHDTPLSGSRSGQILWIRGLTRLQTQVGFSLHVCVISHSYYKHNLHMP